MDDEENRRIAQIVSEASNGSVKTSCMWGPYEPLVRQNWRCMQQNQGLRPSAVFLPFSIDKMIKPTWSISGRKY
jgi:hypothetical protein